MLDRCDCVAELLEPNQQVRVRVTVVLGGVAVATWEGQGGAQGYFEAFFRAFDGYRIELIERG